MHLFIPLKMVCISVIGAFAFLFLSCAAANRQADQRDQREKDGFMGDPLIGIEGDLLKSQLWSPGKWRESSSLLMMTIGEFISSAR